MYRLERLVLQMKGGGLGIMTAALLFQYDYETSHTNKIILLSLVYQLQADMEATEQLLRILSCSPQKYIFSFSFIPFLFILSPILLFFITSKPLSYCGHRQVLLEVALIFCENMAIFLLYSHLRVYFISFFYISDSNGLNSSSISFGPVGSCEALFLKQDHKNSRTYDEA